MDLDKSWRYRLCMFDSEALLYVSEKVLAKCLLRFWIS